LKLMVKHCCYKTLPMIIKIFYQHTSIILKKTNQSRLKQEMMPKGQTL
jgi:hypothetical protein